MIHVDEFGRHCAAFGTRIHRALHRFGNQRGLDAALKSFSSRSIDCIFDRPTRCSICCDFRQLGKSHIPETIRRRSVLNTERELDQHTWLRPPVTVRITRRRTTNSTTAFDVPSAVRRASVGYAPLPDESMEDASLHCDYLTLRGQHRTDGDSRATRWIDRR